MPIATLSADGPSLGLDIGSGVVKLVIAGQVADRIDLKAVGSYDLPPGILEKSVVRDSKAFGRVLKEELLQQGVQPAHATVSIPSSLAVLRWITLPILFGDELREAARFKVKRHLPFPVDTAYVEASEPVVRDGMDSAEYLVIAVRRDVIDSRAEAIESAGLLPIGAELEAQAILRVIERRLREQSPLWRDASLTIIDVGANHTHMYVVQNQRLQFLRGVKFGSEGFSSAVAKELQIPKENAFELLSNSSTELSSSGILELELEGMHVKINVESELEKLTREFLRLLRYFRSLHPERSYAGILDHILMCGGLAGLRGFAEYLQGCLGLRVERARPFTGMVGKFSKDSFESISTRQEAYTVAMGLALSGLQGTKQQRGENHARREFIWARGA